MTQNPEKLRIYQDALDLFAKVYQKTKNIEGNFRLREQLHAAASSVANNLAESCGCSNLNEVKHKVEISRQEAYELESLLTQFKAAELISETDYKELINQLKPLRMGICNYIKGIQKIQSA
jgi:four helix bundle protein